MKERIGRGPSLLDFKRPSCRPCPWHCTAVQQQYRVSTGYASRHSIGSQKSIPAPNPKKSAAGVSTAAAARRSDTTSDERYADRNAGQGNQNHNRGVHALGNRPRHSARSVRSSLRFHKYPTSQVASFSVAVSKTGRLRSASHRSARGAAKGKACVGLDTFALPRGEHARFQTRCLCAAPPPHSERVRAARGLCAWSECRPVQASSE